MLVERKSAEQLAKADGRLLYHTSMRLYTRSRNDLRCNLSTRDSSLSSSLVGRPCVLTRQNLVLGVAQYYVVSKFLRMEPPSSAGDSWSRVFPLLFNGPIDPQGTACFTAANPRGQHSTYHSIRRECGKWRAEVLASPFRAQTIYCCGGNRTFCQRRSPHFLNAIASAYRPRRRLQSYP